MVSARLFLSRPISSLHVPWQAHIVWCNKRILKLAKLGRVAEARHLFDGMPQRDAVTWNSMISGYTLNDRLREAKSLFESFLGKNVRTWTIMLTAYARNGLIDEALTVFESMPKRNVVSWNAMISGYVQDGHLRKARKLFDDMPERNVGSWNAIITGYCRCGMVDEALELFEKMGNRDSVTWVVMISAYVEVREHAKAWSTFVRMLRSGLRVDQPILAVASTALMGLEKITPLLSFRTICIKTGFERDVVVITAILNVYTRVGSLESAVEFFEAMPERNAYTWTTMIAAFSKCYRLEDAVAIYDKANEKCVSIKTAMLSAYAQNGRINEARQLFDDILEPNVVAWNAMVAGYAQNGMLQEAEHMFKHIPVRNATSWAAMISGFVHNGNHKDAIELFAEFHGSGMCPSHSSFTSSLFACAYIGDVEMGRQIHTLAIKRRCQFNCFVGNALISMYAKNNNIGDLYHAFNTMRVRDIVSWNSVISGVSKNCMLEDAWMIFERMPQKDAVSWAAIISAYEQAGSGDKALTLFIKMLDMGHSPSELAVTSLLTACGKLGNIHLGKQIHALVCKLGFDLYIFLCNALLTMYFRCGCIDGFGVFGEMPDRDMVTWNAILGGCAQNKLGKEALMVFEQMRDQGVSPDDISFLGLLSACSQAGLVDEGQVLFSSMIQDYGISPSVYHYRCMAKLLGKVGKHGEAEALLDTMGTELDSFMWEALADACRDHHNFEFGKRVSEKLLCGAAEASDLHHVSNGRVS